MKVPTKTVGKWSVSLLRAVRVSSLNENPSQKEGKSPPPLKPKTQPMQGLDESPSQKEGKYEVRTWRAALAAEPQ